MRDFVTIGSVPSCEPCACVGEEDYGKRALKECVRFIRLLRKQISEEPPGARLAPRWFDHDFGQYVEVVCHYEDQDTEATEYAFRCANDMPEYWEDESTEETLVARARDR